MTCLLGRLIVSFLCVVSCLAFDWYTFQSSLSSAIGNADSDVAPQLMLRTNTANYCIFDKIQIYWDIRESFDSVQSDYLLAVRNLDTNVVHVQPLFTDFDRQSNYDGPIKCVINEEHCIPSVTTITALTTNPQNIRLSLQLSSNTTVPDLPNSTMVANAFEFNPPLIGYANASWTRADLVEVAISTMYFNELMRLYQSGYSVSVTTRNVDRKKVFFDSIKGINNRSFVATEQSNLDIYVIDSATLSIVSNVVRVTTVACATINLLPFTRPSQLHVVGSDVFDEHGKIVKTKPIKDPSVVLRIAGIVPMTGRRSLVIPNRINAIRSGTWTLSWWMMLLYSDSGEKHQSFLFKGDPSGGAVGRTPSIWLSPFNRQMHLQVSTAVNSNTGVDTDVHIAPLQWTQITIVCENISSALVGEESNSTAPKYKIGVYVNGTMKVEVSFRDEVQGNPYDLLLFYDGTHPGLVGFSKSITLWNAALSQQHIFNLFSSGVEDTRAVDLSVELLRQTAVHGDITTKPSRLLRKLHRDEVLEAIDDESDQEHGRQLLQLAAQARQNCTSIAESFLHRLNLYAQAAELGAAEGLYYWSMMLAFGSERADVDCGAGEDDQDSASSTEIDMLDSHAESSEACERSRHFVELRSGNSCEGDDLCRVPLSFAAVAKCADAKKPVLARAALALLVAADMGYGRALVPLYEMLVTGMGVQHLINELYVVSDQSFTSQFADEWALPVHPDRLISFFANVGKTQLPHEQQAIHHSLRRSSVQDFDGFEVESDTSTAGDIYSSMLVIKHDSFAVNFLEGFVRGSNCTMTGKLTDGRLPVGVSAMCLQAFNKYEDRNSVAHSASDSISVLADALLFLAGVLEEPEAHAILMNKYSKGIGVTKDIETAIIYAVLASEHSSSEFHKTGGQPIIESDRINDHTAREISKGNSGKDDELIQYQKVLADEGDVNAMLSMGDLYYYGARGMPRDQAQALDYYTRAADRGSLAGMCGAGGMLVKGEGGQGRNVTRALNYYETAAGKNFTRALNGLGFLYFYGEEVDKNLSKAFNYFLQAAVQQIDGDSLFNAGYCLENGLGVNKTYEEAAQLYSIAASKFGHFDSVHALARMYMLGLGVDRSPSKAINYFSAAVSIGPWSRWIRRGLDHYLRNNYIHALNSYLMAAEFGYEVAFSNAAYLLQRKLRESYLLSSDSFGERNLRRLGKSSTELVCVDNKGTRLRNALIVRTYAHSAYLGRTESYFQMGHLYFDGFGVHKNKHLAKWWYSKASAHGHALSSVYLGVIHQFGLGIPKNLQRAEAYYKYSLQRDPMVGNQQNDGDVGGATGSAMSSADNTMDATTLLPLQLKALVHSLLWMCTSRSFSFLSPVSVSVDYVVRLLWGAD